LIELAYLSALLEQHPYGPFQPVSHKVEVITRFLKDVVQVVPLESIAYAIAYGKPDEISIQCAEAFMSTRLNLPLSKLMAGGLTNAKDRIHSGVSPDVIKDLCTQAQRQFPDAGSGYRYGIIKDSKQLTVAVFDEKMTASKTTSLDREKLKEEYGIVPAQHVAPIEVVTYMLKIQNELVSQERAAKKKGNPVNVICRLSVEQLYPITIDPTQQLSTLKSPLNILRAGKQKLVSLTREAREVAPAKRHLSSDSQHPKEKSAERLKLPSLVLL